MWRTAVVVSAGILMFSGLAFAGPLATDVNAYYDGTDTWSGTVDLDSGAGLHASVDYCVYRAADFTYAGYTPTPGEFVYAYQLNVIGSLHITSFFVGMLPSNEADNIGSFEIEPGDLAPASAVWGNSDPQNLDTAIWNFDGFNEGMTSYGLVYSSINAPLWDIGAVVNGGDSAVSDMPSPGNEIPEPATVSMLAAMGILGLLRRRRAN